MRLAVLLLTLALARTARAAEQVRIEVADDLARAEVSGKDLRVGAWEQAKGLAPLHASRVMVDWVRGKLRLDGKPVGESLRLRSAGGLLSLHGFAMRGSVDLKATRRGILVVNAIPLEKYLAAVLGGEMPPSFPMEALKAQAVAARTYAIQRKLSRVGRAYHMGRSVLSQVYGGAKREDARTRAAVRATRGQILTYDLVPIEAYFHASCGGRTESGKDALGRDLPYLQPVSCPCGRDPHTHWKLFLSDRTLARKLGLRAESLHVVRWSGTHRALRLSDGKKYVDGVTFRRVLGYLTVKSLLFRITHRRGGVELTGRGIGHGAGMCQYGAKIFAQEGWTYRQILAHYYKGTIIQRLY